MSRIGKKPVAVPSGITAEVKGQQVSVKGPKGQLNYVVNDNCLVEMNDNEIVLTPKEKNQEARSLWGLSRTMVSNIIEGVNKGFERKLEINGVGYRAQMQGSNLQLALGYSHDVLFPVPEGITIVCPKPTEIVISGIDKQVVGEVAAKIREFRPPEPYKGKGIKYAEETIFRKEGKKK